MSTTERNLPPGDGKCLLYNIINNYIYNSNCYLFILIIIYFLFQAFDAMHLHEVYEDDISRQRERRAFQDVLKENQELRQAVKDLEKTIRQHEVNIIFILSFFNEEFCRVI